MGLFTSQPLPVAYLFGQRFGGVAAGSEELSVGSTIGDPEQHVGILDDLFEQIGVTLGAISFEDKFVGRVWEDDATLEQRKPAADDLIQIQYTSGTSGEPKGVLHSHNTVRSGCRAVEGVFGLGGDDVCFMASTQAHQTGFALGMHKPISMGATIVYQHVWDADALLGAIETEHIAWTVPTTPFMMDLIAAQVREPHDLSSFRFFICGGAPIPPKVVEDAQIVLGAELIAVWGMAENLVVTATRPGDSVELVSDSDGLPVEAMEVRVVDDAGKQVDGGIPGNLQVRGPSQALGYFHRPDLYDGRHRTVTGSTPATLPCRGTTVAPGAWAGPRT